MNELNLRQIPIDLFSFKEESNLIKEIDNSIQHQFLKVIFNKTKEKMKSNITKMNNIEHNLSSNSQDMMIYNS